MDLQLPKVSASRNRHQEDKIQEKTPVERKTSRFELLTKNCATRLRPFTIPGSVVSACLVCSLLMLSGRFRSTYLSWSTLRCFGRFLDFWKENSPQATHVHGFSLSYHQHHHPSLPRTMIQIKIHPRLASKP